MRRLTLALLFLAAAGIGTLLLYSRTIGYGFDYDDYHFNHPYSSREVAAAFRGPWDASAIELPYYRPLTIAFFAARFELLGVDSVTHHALSLILFAFAGLLTGWLVYRLTARASGGLLAVLFFVAHPAMPYSLAAWVTNQMHLLETILVLLALCWWDAVRRRSAVWWTPLLVLAIAAFLVKEDGIMLLPSVVVLHLVRRQFAERDLRVPWTFIALSGVVVAALLFVRHAALDGVTSRSLPSIAVASSNYWSGLNRVLVLAPADRPWQRAASWFVVAVPVLALLSWRRASPRSRAALVSGLCIALLCNLPFVFITKPEQLHLVALGAIIVLTAGLLAILDSARSRVVRGMIAGVTAGGVAAMAAVTIDITRDFEPFGPIVVSHDRRVEEWAAVPAELREYLARKRERGAGDRLSSNPAVALERITFGTHGRETGRDGGVAFEWMSGPRADILLAPNVRTVVIPLRHAIEIFKEPVHVSIEADGRGVDQMELSTPEWRMSETAVGRMRPPWFGSMHRIAIRIDRVWQPSKVMPGSGDDRVLGLQLGAVTVRSRSSVRPADAPR